MEFSRWFPRWFPPWFPHGFPIWILNALARPECEHGARGAAGGGGGERCVVVAMVRRQSCGRGARNAFDDEDLSGLAPNGSKLCDPLQHVGVSQPNTNSAKFVGSVYCCGNDKHEPPQSCM